MDTNTSMLAFGRLMERRKIMLDGQINDETATVVVAQLLFVADEGSAPIELFINSPGGAIPASMAILDTMGAVEAEVETICNGQAAGTAVMLIAAGARGRRKALPNARFHLTPFGPDREYRMEELEAFVRMRREIYERFAALVGRTAEEVEADCESRKILSAEEAREYGIVDQVGDVG